VGDMKNKRLWWFLLAVGLIPFAAPFLGFAYEMLNSSSWSLMDWLILYSFVYWPTYLVGFVLIAISVYKLMK
jgi:magnesium-transporting ATPase (P-type)